MLDRPPFHRTDSPKGNHARVIATGRPSMSRPVPRPSPPVPPGPGTVPGWAERDLGAGATIRGGASPVGGRSASIALRLVRGGDIHAEFATGAENSAYYDGVQLGRKDAKIAKAFK